MRGVCGVDTSDDGVRVDYEHQLNVQIDVWIIEGGES